MMWFISDEHFNDWEHKEDDPMTVNEQFYNAPMVDCPSCGAAADEDTVCGECDAEQFYKGKDWTPEQRQAMKLGGRDNTAFHFDSGKPMMDQLPPTALIEVAKVFTYGAEKYGPHNWQEHADGWDWNQLYASCQRHLTSWQACEDVDPESGLYHLAHACCNLMMLITLQLNGRGTDDRGPIYKEKEHEGLESEAAQKGSS
jgi:ribosomal protein L32